MARLSLTPQNVLTLPAIGGRQTDYFDAELPGFVLRVNPSGLRSYYVFFRVIGGSNHGKLRRRLLGRATSADPGLKSARAKARAIKDKRQEAKVNGKGFDLDSPKLGLAKPWLSDLTCHEIPLEVLTSSGIYVLFKGGRLQYVGQTIDALRRLREHRYGTNKKIIQYDKAFFFECQSRKKRIRLEAAIIRNFRPPLNGPGE